jgi:hypothetical protein
MRTTGNTRGARSAVPPWLALLRPAPTNPWSESYTATGDEAADRVLACARLPAPSLDSGFMRSVTLPGTARPELSSDRGPSSIAAAAAAARRRLLRTVQSSTHGPRALHRPQ